MRVLVVDDSMTIRSMLKRALRDVHHLEVSEASNGVEALEEIGKSRFDLVILDVSMPVMDGVDTLEAIRSSPAHAALPVVMLTGERSEAVVRRLVELGISDFLSKPLSPDVLATRLARIVDRQRASAAPPAATTDTARPRTVLFVEQDPDRRHFLHTVLSSRFALIEADSAAAALQRCADPSTPPIDIVFAGEQVGLPPLEMFLARLRAQPAASGARVIVCVPAGGMRRTGSASADAVMEWSFVPAGFLQRFDHALSGDHEQTSALCARLEHDVVSATEQLFGLMLSSDITLVDAASPAARAWRGHGVHAAIDLSVDGTPALSVALRAEHAPANAITAQLIGVSPGEVHDADVRSTISEFVNIIVGRLRNRLTETGVKPTMGLPRTWVGDTAADFPAATGQVKTLTFSCSTPAASFDVLFYIGGPLLARGR